VFNILFFPKTLESMRLVETCKGDEMYSVLGRPSIPSERLLQAFHHYTDTAPSSILFLPALFQAGQQAM